MAGPSHCWFFAGFKTDRLKDSPSRDVYTTLSCRHEGSSKPTGSVGPAQILEYAPGQLLNLPGFKPLGDPEKSTLAGFEAVQSAGTYTYDGKARVIAQKTVVIPGNDSLFALQLNADAPQAQEAVVIDAAKIIDEQTKIAEPKPR